MSYALREAARAFRDAMEVAPREIAPRDESWHEPTATPNAGAEPQPAVTSETVAKKKANFFPERAARPPLVLEPARAIPARKAPVRKRVAAAMGRWLTRRLQRRVAKEWREYEEPPEVSVGPFWRRHRKTDGSHVYRSLVQIHFHR
jgi:hypothetical protein